MRLYVCRAFGAFFFLSLTPRSFVTGPLHAWKRWEYRTPSSPSFPPPSQGCADTQTVPQGHRLPIARVFSEQMGCNIFILSYRGYGFSTGRPSEKGLLIDAQTALTYLLSNESTRNTQLFVYGQSLGGALAIQLVARNQDKVQGLILENTFRSIRTLIPTVFPPARYLARLCHQIWPSEKTLPRIASVPVLFLSGLKDELVP